MKNRSAFASNVAMTIVVYLASALLCTAGQCYPALVGHNTPVGTFPLVRRYVAARGYGGDVMQFAETERDLLAIHRVWLGNPREHRAERLASGDPAMRRTVSHGCINVTPEVYDQVVAADTLEIRE